jgi:hypothetical protein
VAAIPPEYIDTTTSTTIAATAGNILSGKVAYVNGIQLTGTLASNKASDITVTGANVIIPSGYYSS